MNVSITGIDYPATIGFNTGIYTLIDILRIGHINLYGNIPCFNSVSFSPSPNSDPLRIT